MKLFAKTTSQTSNPNHHSTKPLRIRMPGPVYYVECPTDDTVLVGINVVVEHRNIEGESIFKISWYDTSHERIMLASKIVNDGNSFSFERLSREGGGNYRFAPMNLDIYNTKVKKHLLAGGNFATNEDLIQAFLKTTENSFRG